MCALTLPRIEGTWEQGRTNSFSFLFLPLHNISREDDALIRVERRRGVSTCILMFSFSLPFHISSGYFLERCNRARQNAGGKL